MVRSRQVIIICLLMIGAAMFQYKMGNIDFQYFAFPVNIALLLLVLGITHVAYQEKREHKAVQLMMSTSTSIFLLLLTFLATLVIAFAPHLQFQRSWPFNLIILSLLINLQLVIMRYKGKHRQRFYLTHIGLFIFISSLSFGAPDTHRSRAIISEGQTIEQAYTFDNSIRPIGFPLTLQKFEVSYYENNVPRSFKATIKADSGLHDILVNHPWKRSWKEDIYLVSHGIDKTTNQPYCVLEFITQPWKYLVHFGLLLTALGAFMLLWGKNKNKKL